MISRSEISFDKSIPYHVLTRAVEKREIFANEEDCLRFIFQMYAANVGKPAFNLHRKDTIKVAKALLSGEEISEKFVIIEHPPLINFLSFTLVINHNHFIIVPNIEKGISIYLHKLNLGFAKYFNLKHNRQSNLFARPYKIIPIYTDFQLDAILRYVNVKNPLDIYQPGWREQGLKDWEEAFKFLENYQFSSFPDLFGERNSKILASKETIGKFLGKEITSDREDFINFIKSYLQNQMLSYYPFFLEES